MIRRTSRWATIAWIVLIVSGASTTGLLRARVTNQSVVPLTYQTHRFAGTLVGLLGLTQLIRVGRHHGWTWLGATLIAGTIALGWMSAASLEPRTVVAHAFTAAVAAAALSSVVSSPPGSAVSSPAHRPRWMPVSAQIAVGLVCAQIAVGAMLRHQQIALTPHLLVAGLAVLALLAPAAAILQDTSTPAVERHAARWAITAVIVQVALGAVVLLMIVIGPPSVTAWLAATIAHVTVGTLTLVASVRFMFALSSP
jgi:hypothetical protein